MPSDLQKALTGRYAVAVMFFVNGFVMGSFVLQIPFFLPRFDVTEGTVGLMILMLGLGAVGAMSFAGRILHHFGSRHALIGLALVAPLSLPVIAYSPGIAPTIIGMVALGAFAGCMDVAMNANAVEVEKRLNRAIMSSSHGFWSLGGFAGSLAGGLFIERFSPEAQALAATAVALALVILAAPWLAAEPPAPRPQDGTRTQHWPREPAVYLVGMMALFSMVPEGAIMDWAALFLQKEHGASIAIGGFGFATFCAAMAIMRFLGDAVRTRFGAVQTMRISALTGCAGMLMASLAPFDWLAILGFGIAGIGIANTVPIAFSAAGNQPGTAPATGIAAVTMIGYSGILMGPSIFGFSAEHFGYQVSYFGAAMLLLVVAVLATRVAAADRVQQPPAPVASPA